MRVMERIVKDMLLKVQANINLPAHGRGYSEREYTMKKIMIIMVVVLVAALAGTAMAAGTATLSVSASVVGTCKFSTNNGTISFGDLNPDTGTDISITNTSITYWCTKNVNPGFVHDSTHKTNCGGNPCMQGAGATPDYIQYALTLTPGGIGAGPSTIRTLTVDATVLKTEYANKNEGAYSDTVTITITP